MVIKVPLATLMASTLSSRLGITSLPCHHVSLSTKRFKIFVVDTKTLFCLLTFLVGSKDSILQGLKTVMILSLLLYDATFRASLLYVWTVIFYMFNQLISLQDSDLIILIFAFPRTVKAFKCAQFDMLQSLVHIHRPNFAPFSSIFASELKSQELPHDHGVDIVKLGALT